MLLDAVSALRRARRELKAQPSTVARSQSSSPSQRVPETRRSDAGSATDRPADSGGGVVSGGTSGDRGGGGEGASPAAESAAKVPPRSNARSGAARRFALGSPPDFVVDGEGVPVGAEEWLEGAGVAVGEACRAGMCMDVASEAVSMLQERGLRRRSLGAAVMVAQAAAEAVGEVRRTELSGRIAYRM